MSLKPSSVGALGVSPSSASALPNSQGSASPRPATLGHWSVFGAEDVDGAAGDQHFC